MNKYFFNSFYIKGKILKAAYKALAIVMEDLLTPAVSVAAIVDYENHLLFIKRNDGFGYGLPGGMVRWNETTQNALRREVWEETGLSVEVKALFNVFSGPERDPRLSTVCIVYLAEYSRGKLRGSSEGTPVWVPCQRLSELNYAFDNQQIVDDYRKCSIQRLFIKCPFSAN